MGGVLSGVAWVAWGHSESSFCPSSQPGMHSCSELANAVKFVLQGALQLQPTLACKVLAHDEGVKPVCRGRLVLKKQMSA